MHPGDPDCLLASVRSGPADSARGQLFRSDDGARTWSRVSDGFPGRTRGNIDAHHLAFSRDATARAVAARTLYRSPDRGRSWQPHWEAPGAIVAIACGSLTAPPPPSRGSGRRGR
ncbi:MAG: hypothetical protein AB1505_28380 [Candidatus Latescibacterota bacterium]